MALKFHKLDLTSRTEVLKMAVDELKKEIKEEKKAIRIYSLSEMDFSENIYPDIDDKFKALSKKIVWIKEVLKNKANKSELPKTQLKVVQKEVKEVKKENRLVVSFLKKVLKRLDK